MGLRRKIARAKGRAAAPAPKGINSALKDRACTDSSFRLACDGWAQRCFRANIAPLSTRPLFLISTRTSFIAPRERAKGLPLDLLLLHRETICQRKLDTLLNFSRESAAFASGSKQSTTLRFRSRMSSSRNLRWCRALTAGRQWFDQRITHIASSRVVGSKREPNKG